MKEKFNINCPECGSHNVVTCANERDEESWEMCDNCDHPLHYSYGELKELKEYEYNYFSG